MTTQSISANASVGRLSRFTVSNQNSAQKGSNYISSPNLTTFSYGQTWLSTGNGCHFSAISEGRCS